ncbi:MAG: flavodoxin family protein [Candidatus Omnitrophica bacterium]|nr:flavodoxin family protein [Candidatus Omnitrophota bacterium]
MNVIGISGSPRRGGNSETLLDEALKGAKAGGAKIEKLVLNELVFEPCQECEKPQDEGYCLIDDGMSLVYEKVMGSGVVVVASPVFFGSVSAQTKMMVDRFQCLWRQRFLTGSRMEVTPKKGVFIAVSDAGREQCFKDSGRVMRNFFTTIGAVLFEELFVPGLRDKGDVSRVGDVFLRRAADIGTRIVEG